MMKANTRKINAIKLSPTIQNSLFSFSKNDVAANPKPTNQDTTEIDPQPIIKSASSIPSGALFERQLK